MQPSGMGCPRQLRALGPFGPSLTQTPPGAQTWALGLAAALCKVVLRPSDLQVPFSIAMGEPGAPSTRGHPWFPSLAWLHCQGPSSWHKNYQDLQLVLGGRPSLSSPDQAKLVLPTPGSSCPWPCHPSSPALCCLQDLRRPSACWRRTCFYLLKIGTTRHMEGEVPLACLPLPPPLDGGRTAGGGEGRVLGQHLLWQQRVKAHLPGLAPGLAGVPLPSDGLKALPPGYL